MKLSFNYLRWFTLLTLFVFLCENGYGQGTGLILEDKSYKKIPQVSKAFSGTIRQIPQKVSLKEYCPEIISQGEIGSCVGWATGYGAFTIMKAKAEGWTDVEEITKNAYSAMYIYNQTKIGDCYEGSLFTSALNFLKREGDCLSKEFDNPREDCSRNPGEEIKKSVEKNTYEVKDFFTLFKPKEAPQIKINQAKTSLSEGKPVVIGMMIKENFKELNKDEEYWKPTKGNTGDAGGHAMVVVGYNDMKGAFEVMNTWGTEWGNNGYCWVKYEDFGKYCVYGYQLLVAKKEVEEAEPSMGGGGRRKEKLSAQFVFRYPVGYDEENEMPIFKEATTNFNGQNYVLIDKKWKENQRFQLITRKITKDRYVYVFSIDTENNIRVHWPRHQQFNEKFIEYNEGAIVPYKDVQIIVPGKDRALIKDKVGKDYLVVLVSIQPIDDLSDRIDEILGSEGDYLERLYKSFGTRLIPASKIEYKSNMQFSTTTQKGGYIVPLLLEVEN